jgi:integrase
MADVEEFVEAETADTSRSGYAKDFARFEAWARAAGGLPTLPTTPQVVALYLAALAKGRVTVEWRSRGGRPMQFSGPRRLATLRRAYASIAHHQRAAGHDWQRGHPAIVRVMRGIARTFAGDRTKVPRKAQALELEMLRRALANHRQDLVGIRDRALILMMWFGCLRRSDAVPRDVDDIRFVREGFVITIIKSKANQAGEPEEVAVPFASDHTLCPVRALRAWLDAAQITTGAIFRAVSRHGKVSNRRMHLGSVSQIIKTICDAAGLDPERFSSHSPRSGFATSASEKGRSLEEIMKQGRWKSERVARGYIRRGTLWTKNPAAGLA